MTLAARSSRSEMQPIRGLQYHVRIWPGQGPEHGRKRLFLLHGWMDLSASFQFIVDRLPPAFEVIAPDWRGFGLSEWSANGYWFPDYYADLEALLHLYSPDAPATLVGHSMGGNIACAYAGMRPQQVTRLITLEGLGMPATDPSTAPDRYGRWLDEQRTPPRLRSYDRPEDFAARLQRDNPRLSAGRAAFIAAHALKQTDNGQYELHADPRHKGINPYLYQLDEMLACWRNIRAERLVVWGRESHVARRMLAMPDDLALRRAALGEPREIWLEGCGHMLHHERPDLLAEIIADFCSPGP